MKNLKSVFEQVYVVLKPNKRCCSVVMDIRKKDKFYPLHEDQTRIMREIGFELEEYVIWDRQKEYNNMKTLGYVPLGLKILILVNLLPSGPF